MLMAQNGRPQCRNSWQRAVLSIAVLKTLVLAVVYWFTGRLINIPGGDEREGGGEGRESGRVVGFIANH